MMHSGTSEMINPATGIRLSRKIMTPSANKYGKPSTVSPTTVKAVLNNAIRICASITLPKDRMNFCPKYSSSL
ncbi:hypothetical protein D3C76_1547770 [compost metagenome]